MQPASPRTTGGYGIHPNYNPFVGTELTLVAGYAVTSFAQVEAGYGHFFSGDYIAQSQAANGGSRDADFVYRPDQLQILVRLKCRQRKRGGRHHLQRESGGIFQTQSAGNDALPLADEEFYHAPELCEHLVLLLTKPTSSIKF